MSKMGKEKLSKLYMGNLPNVSESELRKFLVDHGINESNITGIYLKKGYAFIDCLDQSTADAMIDKIHEQEFQGKKLSLEPSLTSGVNQGIRARVAASVSNGYRLGSDHPLKILIPSEFVGAIIGRGGSNIKELTMSTGARINILRNRSNSATVEKTACIIGPAEHCSAACKRILQICSDEAKNSNDGKEVILKILAQNALIGRVIGKEGKNIKKIMQDTQTKIHVSNQVQSESLEWNMNPNMDTERVITIRGSIEGMSNAENLISSKLRADMPGFMPTGQIPHIPGRGGGRSFSAYMPAFYPIYPYGGGSGSPFAFSQYSPNYGYQNGRYNNRKNQH